MLYHTQAYSFQQLIFMFGAIKELNFTIQFMLLKCARSTNIVFFVVYRKT